MSLLDALIEDELLLGELPKPLRQIFVAIIRIVNRIWSAAPMTTPNTQIRPKPRVCKRETNGNLDGQLRFYRTPFPPCA